MGSGLVFCFRGSQILTLDILVMYVANHKKENAQSQKLRPDPTATSQKQKTRPDPNHNRQFYSKARLKIEKGSTLIPDTLTPQ